MNTLKNKENIKQLTTRLTKLNVEKENLVQECNNIHTKITNLKKEISKLQEVLDSLSKNSNGKIQISEHFLIRYCERVLNIDFELIKVFIDKEIQPFCDILGGNGTFPLEGKWKIVIKDNTAVTIID